MSVDTVAAERDFLLRSLADLEREHAAGELGDARFLELYDEYTTQAAIALRALERLQQQTSVPTAEQHRRRRRTWIPVAAVVLAVTVAGAVLLVRSLATRQSGQTITGNAQSTVPDLATLAAAAAQRPSDAQAQLDYAFALLNADQAADAVRAFDAAARLDPTNPVPQAYAGWIIYLAGLPDEALLRLDAAIAADPGYPDAHFFRGMVLLRATSDEPGARAEFETFLRLAPSGPMRAQVQSLLDDIDDVADAETTPASSTIP